MPPPLWSEMLAAMGKDTAVHPLLVAALNKGKSHSDELTTTIARAIRVIAACLHYLLRGFTGLHSRVSFESL